MLRRPDLCGSGASSSAFPLLAAAAHPAGAVELCDAYGGSIAFGADKQPVCGQDGLSGGSTCGYGGCLSGSVPSRHLLVSNLNWAADRRAVKQLFGCFGPLDAVQMIPEQGAAVLTYASATNAEAAKASLSDMAIAVLTGGRQLLISFLHPDPTAAAALTAAAAAAAAASAAPASILNTATACDSWPAALSEAAPRGRPSGGFDDTGSDSGRTSTTSSRHESDDAATLTETMTSWRSVRRNGSSATSTSLDVSDCDAADVYGSGGLMTPHCGAGATLWLGNLDLATDRCELEALLMPFGPLDGLCFFPDRGVAFANFLSAEDAAAAKVALDGRLAPLLPGNRPLRVEFQHAQELRNLCPALDERLPQAGAPSCTRISHTQAAVNAVTDLVQLPPANAAPLVGGSHPNGVISRTNSGRSSSSVTSSFAAAAAPGPIAGFAAAAAAPVVNTDDVIPAPLAMPPVPLVPAAPAAPASDVPSRHLWLGNILQNVDRQAVEMTFSRFGALESTRIFPDKHFAFVNYLSLENAVAARAALRGQTVPVLSGARALEVRFQHRRPCQAGPAGQPASEAGPAAAAAAATAGRSPSELSQRASCSSHADSDGSDGSSSSGSGSGSAAAEQQKRGSVGGGAVDGAAGAAAAGHGAAAGGGGGSSYDLEPCRHLWLGNVLSSAKQQDLEAVFSRFGPVESVRIFPAKNYAFVNFKAPQGAEAAKLALGGRPVPSLSGNSPLLLRYKRVPADTSLLGPRHAWGAAAADAATAGLLPWLMLLQPGAAAAAGGLTPELAAELCAGNGAATAAAAAALASRSGDAAGALNDLANTILLQALAANSPACLGGLAASSQAALMQGLAYSGMPPAAAAAAAAQPLWGAAMGPYGASCGPLGGGYCRPNDAAADAAMAQMWWCGPNAAATVGEGRMAVGSGLSPATALATEQAFLDSMATAGVLAPQGVPPEAPSGQQDMGALLSAMLLSQAHGHAQ